MPEKVNEALDNGSELLNKLPFPSRPDTTALVMLSCCLATHPDLARERNEGLVIVGGARGLRVRGPAGAVAG